MEALGPCSASSPGKNTALCKAFSLRPLASTSQQRRHPPTSPRHFPESQIPMAKDLLEISPGRFIGYPKCNNPKLSTSLFPPTRSPSWALYFSKGYHSTPHCPSQKAGSPPDSCPPHSPDPVCGQPEPLLFCPSWNGGVVWGPESSASRTALCPSAPQPHMSFCQTHLTSLGLIFSSPKCR